MVVVYDGKGVHSQSPTYPHACNFACPHANKELSLVWISMALHMLVLVDATLLED